MSYSSQTDAVISRLARDAGATDSRPSPRSFEAGLLAAVGAGLVCAIALVFIWFGVQPDLGATLRSAPFHHKLISMLVLAAGGILVVRHLARPGSSPAALLALLPGLAIPLAGALTDPSGYPVLGRSGISVPSCVLAIVLLSVPALAMTLFVLRRGIATRPALAGASAGLLAGALGAAAYAIACKNDGSLFVLVWYGVAVTIVALAGALCGRRLLAW